MTYEFSTQNGRLLSTEPYLNGNSLSSSGQWILLKHDLDVVIPFVVGIADCIRKRDGYEAFSRWPDKDEDTSIDDHLCIGAIPVFARRILTQLRRRWGFLSLYEPAPWKQWLMRIPGFYQHLKLAAGEDLNWFDRMIWASVIMIAACKSVKNQDGWIQSHVMVITYDRSSKRYWACDQAVKYWKERKPAPTSEIVSAYIGDPNHPLVDAWRSYG